MTTNMAKVVLVGESNVGKSSLMQRLSAGTFASNAEATVGAAFSAVRCEIDGEQHLFQIWDVAGQPRYRALIPLYIQHAQLVLLCCDAKTTQAERDAWASEVGGCESVVHVGTKADVAAVADVAVQTSAKSGEGCEALRHLMASHARRTAITPEEQQQQQQPSPRRWWC